MVSCGCALSGALIAFAGPLVTLLMGGRFEPAIRALQILSGLPLVLSITFSSGQLWLLPRQKDWIVLRVVFRAALVNLLLSFMLAPTFGHVGMAFAVLASESVVGFTLGWSALQLIRKEKSAEAKACLTADA
jgi:O-antigen/teichoic acid export membrane protein